MTIEVGCLVRAAMWWDERYLCLHEECIGVVTQVLRMSGQARIRKSDRTCEWRPIAAITVLKSRSEM